MTFDDQLIGLYLHEGNSDLDLASTLSYGKKYLWIIVVQMFPFALMQAYSGTLRETGETVLPLKASVAAVIINVFLNYVFIFGKFGFPALGVAGAAAATVIARIAECAVIVIWTHKHKEKKPFIAGAYSSLYIPKRLIKDIGIKGLPLMINELLWAGGVSTLVQCYSVRGLEVISALNISSTVSNLFNCAFIAIGSSVAIIIGQHLGAGDTERAIEEDRKLIFLSIALCIAIGSVMALLSPFIPMTYNTTNTVKNLASSFILISALMMPFNAFNHASYFTLRSGGKTMITFLYDCGVMWLVSLPTAFLLSRYTLIPPVFLYLAVQSVEIIKSVVGFVLIKRKVWVHNLVGAVDFNNEAVQIGE